MQSHAFQAKTEPQESVPQQAPPPSRMSASPAAEAVPGDALEAQGDSGQPAAKRPNKSGQQQDGN